MACDILRDFVCVSSTREQVRLEFDEHTDAFFGPNGILGPGGGATVRLAPPRQKADLSVESIKALVARVKGIIRWLQVANYK